MRIVSLIVAVGILIVLICYFVVMIKADIRKRDEPFRPYPFY